MWLEACSLFFEVKKFLVLLFTQQKLIEINMKPRFVKNATFTRKLIIVFSMYENLL